MKTHPGSTGLLAATAILLALTAPAGATMVDLSAAGATGSIGNATFFQVDPQATGSGVIDPFVRIGSNRTTERGFNTDRRPLNGDLADVNNSPVFTHSILVSQFGVVDLAGTPSIRFLLDINQTGVSPLLSLDELKVFVADRGDIGSNSDLADEGTLVYDMDAAVDSWVKMDYSLNTGSGSGDMLAYLPATLFAGYGNKYLYLYSKFGVNIVNNSGFEEWARIDDASSTVVPEPATFLLLGAGLAGLAARRRRRA